jgi:hypothetical protein
MSSNPIPPIINNKYNSKCLKYNPVYPSFTPVMSNISVTSSNAGQYSLVYIFGYNFFPNGTTYINFGPFKKIPVNYYGSNNISFVVPLNASVGTYNVVVVNIYNGNFSPAVNFTYPGVLNYSNSYSYQII